MMKDENWRCYDCGRFLAERYPYHTCSDCQERKASRRRVMAAIDRRLAELERSGTPDAR